jgi:2-phospho-L-lactate guanylyltransferase
VHHAVLVPVKRFRAAKGRLSTVLSVDERAELAEWMAAGVLDAVSALPTYVACDDPGVREWAVAAGATIVWAPGRGLNGAVDDGVERIAADGFDHVLVTHADLPRPWALPEMVRPDATLIVPDVRRDGTNVMSFPVDRRVRAAYGGGSFERHLAQCHALDDVEVEVCEHPDLSLDVDTPADLGHPQVKEVLPEWVRTNLASPRSA